MAESNCHKTFWDDPYLSELDTRVQSVDGAWVGLESTIFFAFSGGQESDHGQIGEHPVLEAKKTGLDIRYRLAEDHPLQVGQAVRVHIDWNRRYQLMRLHFAAETVLELVYQTLPGIEKIGAHIAPQKARVDFSSAASLAPMFARWTEQANALFDQDLPILKDFADESSQRRYWAVEGFAHVPCGGTHIHTTGEVGRIRLKRKNIGKGKERIEIYLCD